jgi:hypothetical protein
VSGAGACVNAGTPTAMPSNPAASIVSERFHIAFPLCSARFGHAIAPICVCG